MQGGHGTEGAGNNSDSTPMAGTKPLTESFDQSQRGVLDILLVIDNSGSMRTIIDKVKQNLPNLLKHVEDSNWQIVATGTQVLDCVSSIITKQTPDYANQYKTIVDQGIHGLSEWYFLKAIDSLHSNALTKASVGNLWKCANTSTWLRDNSSIAIIIVADQWNECKSSYYYYSGDDGLVDILAKDPLYEKCNSSDLANVLKAMRPKGNTKVYGLLPDSKTWERYKDRDSGVSSIFATSGLVTDASYAPIFQNISKHVQDILEDVFVLSHVPVGKVEVKVNSNVVSPDLYTVRADSKQLVFDKQYIPSAGDKINVSYRYKP